MQQHYLDIALHLEQHGQPAASSDLNAAFMAARPDSARMPSSVSPPRS